MQVIESDPDDAFIEWIIRQLTQRPLDEVALSPEVQGKFQPILEQHRRTVETVRQRASYDRGVVSFDLVDDGI